MEKGKAFLLMMARRKEEILKTEEGTSSAARPPISKHTTPSYTVNAALQIALEPEPSSSPSSALAPKVSPRKGGGKRKSLLKK